jgi:hypothetical protein
MREIEGTMEKKNPKESPTEFWCWLWIFMTSEWAAKL